MAKKSKAKKKSGKKKKAAPAKKKKMLKASKKKTAKKAAKKVAKKPAKKVAKKPAQKAAPKPAPAPMPSLGVILSPDQKRELDASYQSDLRQANAVLNRLSTRTLTPAQTDTVNRARAFVRQAAQYHDKDLATAAELARRARVLTPDLAGTPK